MKVILLTAALFCLGQVRSSAVLPFPNSCNKFYMCVNDTTYEVVCPNGQFFDYRSRSCGPPTSAICDPAWSRDLNPCTNMAQFIPYPTNCSLYYSCSSEGYAYIYNCFNGRYFSPLGKYCETPEKSGCIPSNTSSGNNACNDTIGNFMCTSNQGRFPYPLSANMYYDCNQPAGSQVFLCATGQYFDRISRDCVTPDRAGCASQLAITTNPCVGALPARSPTNCSVYYTCNGTTGRGQTATCLNGYYFNTSSGLCEPPNPLLCTPTAG